ncbi:MAG: hypothetical protein LQ342_001900 [Letrouitia transgressa]|nr:MAG: hypothetical protein LQ342_001900 [Letrouitia transgressa]
MQVSNVRCYCLIVLLSFKTWLTETVNYKPNLQPSQKATITPGKRSSDTRVDLAITGESGQGEYHYAGVQQPSGACALIYDPSTQSFILNRIDADFTFNLQTTPSNLDSKEVTAQYPQLDTGLSDADSNDGDLPDDLFGDENDDHQTADPNNPYDYRHFLKRRRTSSPEPAPPAPRPSSRAPTISPLTPHRRPPSRTTSAPNVNVKSKTRARPSQHQPPAPAPAPPTPREEADADNEDSDDGILTIEMGDPPPKPRGFNGAVVFNHDRRNGPISLRSAASSMSPASVRQDSEAENGGKGDASSDRDVDVEHLRLPSPKQEVRQPLQQQKQLQEEGDDDEDEDEEDLLEAEIQQALDSEAEEEEDASRAEEEARRRQRVEESSSESEEE